MSSITMSTRQRVHRILRAMKRYRPLNALDAEFNDRITAMEKEDGEPIGAYINDDASAGPVLIAEEALIAQSDGQIVRIRYENIASVQLPPKGLALGVLTVITNDGNVYQLHIDGGSERFRDAYEFSRFLVRACNDAKRSGPGSGQSVWLD